MENLNKIHLEAQQILPKEIKVDAVTNTGPPQDWIWQHFIIGRDGLMSPHPFPSWTDFW